jgi:hypothetical protein
MDADGQAFRLLKQEARCRQRGLRSDCPATITPRNGFASPVPAAYHGLGYAGGGYRHAYSGGGGAFGCPPLIRRFSPSTVPVALIAGPSGSPCCASSSTCSGSCWGDS